MRHVVSGFSHQAGIHCGSTAMADALRAIGLPLTEELAFGLGAGASFILFEGLGGSPSRFFVGRSASYEADLCRLIGVRFDEHPVATFEEAWADIRARLLQDRPVLALCDLVHLPHYRTRTHFNGHRIVIAGFDDEAGLALVGDAHFPGLQEVPLDALARSLTSDWPPLVTTECLYGSLERPASFRSIEEVLPHALTLAADEMLTKSGSTGLAGIERLARILPGWGAAPDWAFCARFCGQIIEKRGCGGGLFRRMYARFLEQAKMVAAATDCVEAADSWTALAQELFAASERPAPELTRAAELAVVVAARERGLWESIRAATPRAS